MSTNAYLPQDTSTNPAVRNAFMDRIGSVEGIMEERLVGVRADSGDESEDDEHEICSKNGKITENNWESMDED